MTTTIDVTAIQVMQEWSYDLIPERGLREVAMAAAGTIRSNVRGAVQKVLEAGQLLQQMKQRLPHGHYLPWVERECQLKPNHASQLIKAASWAKAQHVDHLNGITDTATLFLLSADATPEDVREWFMERAAAGDVPSRAEVAERKRRAAGKPADPRPVELQALSLVRRQQIGELEAALAIARQITTVSDAQVLEEVGLRELPKGKVLAATAADFHRRPDGSGWDRIPHAGRVEVGPAQPQRQQLELTDCAPAAASTDEVLPLATAAARVGMSPRSLTQSLTPKQNPDGIRRLGLHITRAHRGHVRLTPL